MSNASELIASIRDHLRPYHEKIVEHRYLTALEAGRIARDSLKTFARQQYWIIASDLRSVAQMLARHGHLPSRPYLLGVLQGENAAFEALPKFARALGMNDEALRTGEVIAAAFAYSAFVAWLSMYGSDAELAAAFTVNFADWGGNCARISAALQARYQLGREAVGFFELFAKQPPAGDSAMQVVQAGLDRSVSPAAIGRAVDLLQRYELMFWDAMAEAAGV